ncbi:hypothetical protein [Nocardia nova]|uniref:hypothetical protein n=1 Tax=Nocardia nova TaxID=37330 RepID=UPI0033ED8493
MGEPHEEFKRYRAQKEAAAGAATSELERVREQYREAEAKYRSDLISILEAEGVEPWPFYRMTDTRWSRLRQRNTVFYERAAIGWPTEYVKELDGHSYYTLLSFTGERYYSHGLLRVTGPSREPCKGLDYGDGWSIYGEPGVSGWETATTVEGLKYYLPGLSATALNAEALRAIEIAEKLR